MRASPRHGAKGARRAGYREQTKETGLLAKDGIRRRSSEFFKTHWSMYVLYKLAGKKRRRKKDCRFAAVDAGPVARIKEKKADRTVMNLQKKPLLGKPARSRGRGRWTLVLRHLRGGW